ncbi:hypothetical protein KEM52_004932, partial [Ascosphaera acerosa]
EVKEKRRTSLFLLKKDKKSENPTSDSDASEPESKKILGLFRRNTKAKKDGSKGAAQPLAANPAPAAAATGGEREHEHGHEHPEAVPEESSDNVVANPAPTPATPLEEVPAATTAAPEEKEKAAAPAVVPARETVQVVQPEKTEEAATPTEPAAADAAVKTN